MGQNKFHLLTPRLLENKKELREIEYWKKNFQAQLGWHYVLDLIWQLKKIEALQLGPDSKILDAGAGHGLMQFLLSAHGHDVISIDYSPRSISKLHSLLFPIETKEHFTSQEEYTKHILAQGKITRTSTLAKIGRFLKILLSSQLIFEIPRKKSKGKITFLQGDLRDLSIIEDNSVDAIISTSAIEHIPEVEGVKQAIKELKRVLKGGQPMFITTNAAEELWYHEPSKAWCFDEATLKSIFGDNFESDFPDYQAAFQSVKASEYLKNNLAPIYFKSGSYGMPWGKWDPQYTPVGIEYWKS